MDDLFILGYDLDLQTQPLIQLSWGTISAVWNDEGQVTIQIKIKLKFVYEIRHFYPDLKIRLMTNDIAFWFKEGDLIKKLLSEEKRWTLAFTKANAEGIYTFEFPARQEEFDLLALHMIYWNIHIGFVGAMAMRFEIKSIDLESNF